MISSEDIDHLNHVVMDETDAIYDALLKKFEGNPHKMAIILNILCCATTRCLMEAGVEG